MRSLRTVSLSLIFVLLFSLILSSCQQKSLEENDVVETTPVKIQYDDDKKGNENHDPSADKNPGNESPDDEYDGKELPDYNFGGREFTILTSDEQFVRSEWQAASDTSVYQSKFVAERNNEVEFELNAHLIIYSSPASTLVTRVENSNLLGTSYTAVSAQTTVLTPLSLKGQLINLESFPYRSINQPWWNATFRKEIKTDGSINTLCMMVGDLNFSAVDHALMLYANQTLFDNNTGVKPSDIYDAISWGAWTLEYFDTLCRNAAKDLNSDGLYDIYGMCGRSTDITTGFYFATGSSFTKQNQMTGIRSLVTPNEDMFHLREWMQNGIKTEGCHYADTDFYRCRELFSQNKSLFIVAPLKQINFLRENGVSGYIFPLPKYDMDHAGYRTTAREHSAIAFPAYGGMMVERMAVVDRLYKKSSEYLSVISFTYSENPQEAQLIEKLPEMLHWDFLDVYEISENLWHQWFLTTDEPEVFFSNQQQLLENRLYEVQEILRYIGNGK